MTLSDLDTRYHDMLRELRRWGITESDGGINAPAEAMATLVMMPCADGSIGSERHSESHSPSDTTEQKKAA